MNDYNTEIAKRIKSIRKLHRLSQVEFARRLDVSMPIIKAIEANRLICGEELLCRICEEFKVSRSRFIKI